jgi:hypothetical protein
MIFSPTWTDISGLALFISLFLSSGWLTCLFFFKRVRRGQESSPPTKKGSVREGRGSVNGQEFEAAETLPLVESILLSLINALVVTSFILLLTAQLGIFRFRYWLLLLFLYDALLLIFFRKSRRLQFCLPIISRHRFERSDFLLLPLCCLAIFTFYRPSEFILTNRDPGEYVNIAVKLSETGSLKFKDVDFQQFHSKEREELFLSAPFEQAPFQEVLPGFYLVDPVSGEMLPQYFHLFPLWLALAFKLWRFQGIFVLNTFFGILSVLILIPLAQRLFGSKTVGWLSAFLLAINLGQVWMVRSPFSEILAQALLLAGIWTLSLASSEKLDRLCLLAGLLFGLTLFVRIDSLLIVAALLIYSFLLVTKAGLGIKSFPKALFLSGLGLSAAYACLHAWTFAYPYFLNVIGPVRDLLSSWNFRLGIAFLVTGVFLGIWIRRHLGNLLEVNERARERLLMVSFVLVTGLFIYGYFIRPNLALDDSAIPLPSPHMGTVRLYNELNLPRLGWYLSPLGVGLVCLGSLVSLRRLARRGAAGLLAFLLILSIFSLFYLYRSRAFPDNYWVIRRYVEIVIPGFLILAGLAMVSIFEFGSKYLPRKTAVAISSGIFVLLVGWQLVTFYPLLNQTELKGTYTQIENLATLNRDADVLLLEQGAFQDFVSGPLKYIFRKTVYPLANFQPNLQAFEKLMDDWTSQGKRIRILSSEEQTELKSGKYSFVPRGRFEFNTKVVEQTYDHLPQSMEDLRFSVQSYELQRKAREKEPSSITFNMGDNFGFKTSGFYQTESNTDREIFRWSAGSSAIELSRINSSRDAILFLRLGQDLPQGVSSTPIKVFFNRQLIAEPRLSSEFQRMEWVIPRPLLNAGGKNELAFTSGTFSPARVMGSTDRRELGFMLDCIKLLSNAPMTDSHPYFVDLGAESDVIDCELRGFYGKEPESYRWTASQAELRIPLPLDLRQGYEFEISLRAVKSCPDAHFKQYLALSLNDIDLGQTELLGAGNAFKTYHFPVPKKTQFLQHPVIKIRVTPAWNPKRAGYSDDWRTLGCAIDWLKLGGRGS